MSTTKITRSLMISVSSVACLAALTATANAQTELTIADGTNTHSPTISSTQGRVSGPQLVEDYSHIVVRDDISLDTSPPTGALDDLVDVTGVGQMVSVPDPTSGFISLCTGSLINPRTVIFAAHCVNDNAASDFGAASGGIPISFGFSANNRPGARRWLGLDGGTQNATDVDFNIYNVEQVWYDERSLPTGFLEADVAIATLDTHADGIPTWAMLFSPLEEETHGVINGYGARGQGADGANLGIDFRRRIAENMISSLSSLNDRNIWLFGPGDYGLPQNLYMTDFDSPGFSDPFDFDLFDGEALPREGTTAGGDSGGPLVADEAFDKPVVVGVLSGGSRFFGPQPFSSYGTSSFYQPLFLFWDEIVANNSYVYASSKKGNSNWSNPNHWVQDMDPNYNIAVDGELQNALPGFEAPGVSGETPQFGNVCFLDDCFDLSTESVPLADSGPNSVYIEGGPGSTNFVPNNVVADPVNGVKARYYEVTLNNWGKTKLKSDITIDRLNVGGHAHLQIKKHGSLHVWGDYTQTGGWVDIDGSLKTGEAFLGSGILTGSGYFDPTYLTSVRGIIAPGGIGGKSTLTVAGDVILSSQSLIYFDVGRRGGDKLAVVGDADNDGVISLGGTAAVINGFFFNSARWGQRFEIITAEGGIENTFDDVVGRIGILYPELEYNANSVVARMRAARFFDFFRGHGVSDPFSLSLGSALDNARGSSYSALSNVYGLIDVMEVNELSSTFQNLTAAHAGRAARFDEAQTASMRTLVTDRLSLLGTKKTADRKMHIYGSKEAFQAGLQMREGSGSQFNFSRNYQSSTWEGVLLPEDMSGFMSANFTRSSVDFYDSLTNTEQGSWHLASGLEYGLDKRTTLGVAMGYASGMQNVNGTFANLESNMASVYGNYLLGKGWYVGGAATFASTRINEDNLNSDYFSERSLDTRSVTLASEVEAGYNFAIGGMFLTPRASVQYSSYSVSGFQDHSGDLAMAVDGISRAGVDAKVGLKLSGDAKLGEYSGWSLHPEMRVDFVNRLSGNDTNFDLRFLDAQNVALALPVALQNTSYGELRGGLSLRKGPLAFDATVETYVGQKLLRDNRAFLNMTYKF
ncbi:MAG: hypothetical protein DHS20C05_09050 [Hyphococcus sp.]|nr:MAG: hypothetical protein DHS20C05_09050 [Marinicaulis sp.]